MTNEYQIYILSPPEQQALDALDKYLELVLEFPKIKELVLSHAHPLYRLTRPQLVVSKTCGSGIAGQTWYYNNKDSVIELSSWVLYDILEAKRVIRHEVAHVIKSFCKFDGGVHGRGYYKVLRIVSGKVWKRDRRWKNSVSIEKARSKIHPKIRIEFE